jgi:hypothetical protein
LDELSSVAPDCFVVVNVVTVVPAASKVVVLAPADSVEGCPPTLVEFKVSFEATLPTQHNFLASGPRISFIHFMNLFSLGKKYLTYYQNSHKHFYLL